MKSTGLAYLLCCLGFLGFGGIHRFYLEKPVTGILYLMTGGFFWIGTIIDLIRLPKMVEEANLKWQLRQGLTINLNLQGSGQYDVFEHHKHGSRHHAARRQYAQQPPAPSLDPEKSLENTILRLARKFQGKLTPLELAANSSLSLDEADKALENIVRKGYANMIVTDSGNIVYEFAGFLEFDSTSSSESQN